MYRPRASLLLRPLLCHGWIKLLMYKAQEVGRGGFQKGILWSGMCDRRAVEAVLKNIFGLPGPP